MNEETNKVFVKVGICGLGWFRIFLISQIIYKITLVTKISRIKNPEIPNPGDRNPEESHPRFGNGRPGPEILDPSFYDPEKNFILNPEPGPDLKFGPNPEFKFCNFGLARKKTRPGPEKLKKYIYKKYET